MKKIYLKEDDITDINRIDAYNNDYLYLYPNFKPFVTKDNFEEFLKDVQNKKEGINNDGIKEIYYFAIEDDMIVGHGSIRLNPELKEEVIKYSGHIMYGVVPSKRNQGYGTIICKLLLDKMKEMKYDKVIITCIDGNIGSEKIIKNNGGKFIEVVDFDNQKIKRFVVNINF